MERLGINKEWKPTTPSETKLVALLTTKQDALESLEQVCCDLKKANEDLVKRMELLESNLNGQISQPEKKAQSSRKAEEEYATDEDQLAEDTEWIRMKSKRKRKRMEKSLTPSPNQEEKKKALPNEKKVDTSTREKSTPLPPPIIVDKMQNFNNLYQKLTDASHDEFNVKILKNNGVKINPTTPEAYRNIVSKLNEEKLSWYSYQNKQTRPFRVMIKGLHHSCNPNEIVADLKEQGLTPIAAYNKIGWKSKAPLDMFVVSFSHEENTKNIQEIRYVLRTRVQVETLRPCKLIPQCKRCQGYGHTQNYCAREERCVKCIGKHLTKDCAISNETVKPKCCHCGEEHPASYRGCMVAKELQKLKTKSHPKATTRAEIVKSSSKVQKNVSFSEVLKQPRKSDEQKQNLSETLSEILKKLNSFDERLKKIERTSSSRGQNE